jgi:hypothetical protein
MYLVKRQRQLRVVGYLALGANTGLVAVHIAQNLPNIELIALRRQATVNGAGTYGYQGFAIGPEFAQYMHVFCVAQAAFDQPNIAAANGFDVG